MKRLFIALILALGLVGLTPAIASADPVNAGYNMTCDAGTDHCTGWTVSNTTPNIQYFHEWTHMFDPSGAGVWSVTVMQWYICNGPNCSGGSSHAIGWVLHAITYDWAVPHMEHLVGPQATGTLEFAGHAGSLTTNVLRWSPCSFPTQDTNSVSGAPLSSSTGYFNCFSDGNWHNGGGWEWLNPTYVKFKTVWDNRTGGFIAAFNIDT